MSHALIDQMYLDNICYKSQALLSNEYNLSGNFFHYL